MNVTSTNYRSFFIESL